MHRRSNAAGLSPRAAKRRSTHPGRKRSRLSSRAIQRSDHPFQRDQAVTALEKITDQGPVERDVCPDTDPLTTTVGRREEVLTTHQSRHIIVFEPKRDRRPSANTLERGKRSLAGAKVRMSPRRALARLREREAQRANALQHPACGRQWSVVHTSNSALTDFPRWIRRIVSARSGAIERIFMLGNRFSAGTGTVSVVTISAMSG
jgi:hypothetical protein